MRGLLIVLAVVAGFAVAQEIEPGGGAAAVAWLDISFEERERLFASEGRDPEWAPLMEQAITEEVASFRRPPVQLLGAECRSTLCKIEMHWPPNAGRPAIGQQLSYLYGLGIDHQGEYHGQEDGQRHLLVVIARRI